jgi:hypothetical protein
MFFPRGIEIRGKKFIAMLEVVAKNHVRHRDRIVIFGYASKTQTFLPDRRFSRQSGRVKDESWRESDVTNWQVTTVVDLHCAARVPALGMTIRRELPVLKKYLGSLRLPLNSPRFCIAPALQAERL